LTQLLLLVVAVARKDLLADRLPVQAAVQVVVGLLTVLDQTEHLAVAQLDKVTVQVQILPLTIQQVVAAQVLLV
jgi:hypothetical protein